MSIIGIFGGSGSGKTTVTEMLHSKIDDSVVISVDPFMHKHFDENKDEILKQLDISYDENVWWYNYIFQSIDNLKKTIDIIKPKIEADIARSIEENKCYNTIIIDWALLPLVSNFNNCDFAITVNADVEVKVQRLSARLNAYNKLQKWPGSTLLERINNSSLDEFGYKGKYFINNSGSLEQLGNSIDSILSKENISSNTDTNSCYKVVYWDMDV